MDSLPNLIFTFLNDNRRLKFIVLNTANNGELVVTAQPRELDLHNALQPSQKTFRTKRILAKAARQNRYVSHSD